MPVKLKYCVSAVFAAMSLFAGTAMAKDTLIAANIYDAKTTDPIGANEVATAGICLHIYDNLLVQDSNNKLVPALATKYEQIDAKTFKFHLREGVVFHNGEPFTADDVKYTFERAKSPAGGAIKQFVEDIDRVEVINKYTVIFHLKRPFTPFLMALAHTSGSIVNKKAVEEAGDRYGMNPTGTGPFMMESWQKGDKITLVRNEKYWGKKPVYKRLIMRAIPEPTNRTIELESGAVDIAYQIAPMDLSRVADNPKLRLYRVVDNSTTFMGFNCTKKPFDNPDVRRAIAMALNIPGIHKAVWHGVGKPPVAPIAPNVMYAANDLPPGKYDPKAAKALLAKAGVKLPLNVEIWTNERKERIDMATIMQAELAEIGINVKIKVLEWGAYLEGLKAKKHDMFILGWTNGLGDPDFSLSGVFGSTSPSNYGGFSDKKFDEMMEKARQLPNGPERQKLYHDLQVRVTDLQAWVYLHNDEQILGAQKNIRNLVVSPRGYHNLTGVTFSD